MDVNANIIPDVGLRLGHLTSAQPPDPPTPTICLDTGNHRISVCGGLGYVRSKKYTYYFGKYFTSAIVLFLDHVKYPKIKIVSNYTKKGRTL